jgi:hypothetical protein
MNFETLILKSLFTACLLICVLTIGAMVTAKPTVAHVAASHAQVVAATNSAA